MLFEEESNRSDSDVEFLTHFVFETYVVVMAGTSSTQISFGIIFRETLKDYEMLIGEIYKESRSGAEVSPRFNFWNENRRDMDLADLDSL